MLRKGKAPLTTLDKMLRLLPRSELDRLAADCGVLNTGPNFVRPYVQHKIVEEIKTKPIIKEWLINWLTTELS